MCCAAQHQLPERHWLVVLRASGSLLVLVSFVAMVMESTGPAEAAVVATGIAGFSLTVPR